MEALPFILIAGGQALSTYGTLEEGKAEAEYGKLTQKQYGAEAEAVEQAGQYEAREKRKEALRFRARQIAEISANNGLLTGSNLTMLANSAGEFESEAIFIGRNAKVKATQLRNAGAIAAWQGRQLRYASRIRAMADIGRTMGGLALAGGFGGGGAGKSGSTGGVSGGGSATGASRISIGGGV